MTFKHGHIQRLQKLNLTMYLRFTFSIGYKCYNLLHLSFTWLTFYVLESLLFQIEIWIGKTWSGFSQLDDKAHPDR